MYPIINQDVFKQLTKHLTINLIFSINKKKTNNELNIFNQDIFKQLSKHLTHLEHKVTCYIIN